MACLCVSVLYASPDDDVLISSHDGYLQEIL